MARVGDATLRVRYRRDVNDDPEVFTALDRRVDTHVQAASGEQVLHHATGDMLRAEPGDKHVTRPRGKRAFW